MSDRETWRIVKRGPNTYGFYLWEITDNVRTFKFFETDAEAIAVRDALNRVAGNGGAVPLYQGPYMSPPPPLDAEWVLVHKRYTDLADTVAASQPEPVKHVCGARGFGLVAGDVCPACPPLGVV